MFHNVLMTGLTPLRNSNEIHCWDNRPFTTLWPEDREKKFKDTTINKTIKKKSKRNRTVITTEQVRVLEKVFAQSKYIDVERRKEIAGYLQMDQKCVKIWFQNRRMKEKKELCKTCDTSSDSVVSVSPPLETTINNIPDNLYNPYIHPYVGNHVRPQYNYYTQDYLNVETPENNADRNETPHNFAIPEYTNFLNIDTNEYKNDTDYFTQYGSQTEIKYFYNVDDVNNRNAKSDAQDWPVNIFDTSYF